MRSSTKLAERGSMWPQLPASSIGADNNVGAGSPSAFARVSIAQVNGAEKRATVRR